MIHQMKKALVVMLFSLIFFHFSCGGKDPIDNAEEHQEIDGALLSPVEKSIKEAAAQYYIPERFLLAIGYVETGLQPQEMSFKLAGDDILDLPQAKSAFAISRAELGIENDSTQDRLATQIRAYAKWLSLKLKHKGLAKLPQNSQEKFDWIWEIAKLHRSGVHHKYTERSVFSLELIEALNQGFYWLDPEGQETRFFKPEHPQIKVNSLDDKSLNLMDINMRQSQVDFAKKVFLSTNPKQRSEAFPQGIEILHCPFSLSACLDMQNNEELMEKANGLAHYVIPSNDLISDLSLQIRNHFLVLNSNKAKQKEFHKIRVMLVGSSGRSIHGTRQAAYGDWLTHWQLEKLAELTQDLCYQMTNSTQEEGVFETIEECLSPGKAIVFRQDSPSHIGSWLSIPDFDSEIFHYYIGTKATHSKAELTLKDPQVSYSAGSRITFHHDFSPEVHYIEMQQLVRCYETQERLIWQRTSLTGVGNLTQKEEEQKIWSWGPNKDGTHFFRAKFFDSGGNLLAWDSQKILLKNFEEQDNPIARKNCSK